jgi:CNT family concentrative nucleoside transporter
MIALLGILSILALAALCSDNRRRIPLRTVGFALCLQVLFAALVLWLPAGQQVLNGVSESVSSVIGYGQEGIAFLFGDLAKFKLGFIFAFNVLPVIIFFSALIAILYHIGLMPKVIALLGGGLQKLLGTGRAESLSATANIFVGMVEAPLVVKPYLSRMSESDSSENSLKFSF